MTLTSAPHRLRLLRWQAHAAGAPQALAMRSLLRAQSDSLQQHLEQALDDAAAAMGLPPDAVVKIPRLELSVPAPPLLHAQRTAADETAAWSLWVQQLQQALMLQMLQLLHAVAAAPAAAAAGVAKPRPPTGPAQARQDLRQYLHSGWPGWALAGNDDSTRVLQATAAALTDEWVQDDIMGLTPATLRNFWAWAGISPEADLQQALGVLARWLALLPAPRRARWVQARRADQLPLQLGPGGGQATRMALLAQWQAQAMDSLWAQALWLAWPQDPARQAPWQAALQRSDLPDAQPPAALGRLRVALAAAAPRAAAAFAPLVRAEPSLQQPASDTRADPRDERQPPDETETPNDHLVVPLAGLVLLHPYLARLVQGLHMHSGQSGEPLARAVLPRALALLHALACGPAPAPALELDLPFVKLLLGLPPTQALDWPAAQLDEADAAEVQALLQAVRQHWPALRSTSLQTLRVSFLQRRGLLRRAADGPGWQLQVQAEAFDLLLASLPWSLAWVKLPWMPHPLAVDWSAPT